MAYQIITDFKYGMDRRRPRVTGVPGTLWLGKNIHLSRGGDVERAKKFVPTYTLPTGTFGCAQLRGQLFVFGSAAAPTLPIGVQYQRLEATDGSAMTELMDVDNFDGKFYAIARFENGEIHHYYDGTRVTQWDTAAAAAVDLEVLADYMADLISIDDEVTALAIGNVITLSARVAGVPFTLTQSTSDFGGTSDQDITLATVQANVAAVAEVRASTVISFLAGSAGTVTDITVNGVSMMRAPVAWGTSHTATCAAIAVQINNKSVDHGYTALASGNQVTLTAAIGTGVTPNEDAVAATVSGDILLSLPSIGGGVTEAAAVQQVMTATFSGTAEAADLFQLFINDVPYRATMRAAATGTSAFVHKKRVWSPANSLANYSKINDATDWTDVGPSSGAGFLRLSRESEGSERLIASASYGTQMAIFSRNSIQLCTLGADAAAFSVDLPLGNTGALAARAIVPYGNVDVFYLDSPGIRSLKAHSFSGEAYASDIGNPLDAFIREYLDTLPEATIRRAVAVIGPEGRLLVAVGSRIFVLSYFPGSKITAWSYYEPGFDVSDFVRVREKLYARAGDTIYLYGGASGVVYPDDDELEAEVSTAFLTAQTPATIKKLTGFDIACTGQWQGSILVNPNSETEAIRVGELTKTTYNNPNGRLKIPGETSHVAFRFVCSKGGAATISSITIHYDPLEAG